MNDGRLDELIESARHTYRVPADPPVDEMWAAIDEGLDSLAGRAPGGVPSLPARTRGAPWRIAGMAAAAALLLGVGVGRWTASDTAIRPATAGAGQVASAAVQESQLTEPLQSTTADFLGETAVMLKQFENDARPTYAGQASSLLTTTRLLLDSPVATDARLHELLEDFESILAQIAALHSESAGTARTQELQTIRRALRERDVVPRVHTAAVTLASSDD